MIKFDPVGIVDTSGMWKGHPFIHSNAKSSFDSFSGIFMLSLVGNYYFDQYFYSNRELIDNPNLPNYSIDDFLLKNNLSKVYNNKPVYYCKKCSLEMIKDFGFFYFRDEWIRNGYCSIHNIKVKKLKSNYYKDTIHLISNLFRGIETLESSVNYDENLNYDLFYKDECYRDFNSCVLYPIQFSWCAKSALEGYISRIFELELIIVSFVKENYIGNEVLEWEDYINFFAINNSKINLEYPVMNFLFAEYKSYVESINDCCDIIQISNGEYIITRDLIISPKNRNCKTCIYEKCRVKNCNSNNISKIEIKEISSYSDTYKFLSENFKVNPLGFQLWSPLKLISENI